jgi:hypothetical protein
MSENIVRSARRAGGWLKENGFPYSDSIELRRSALQFDLGGQYGVEIPVINTLDVLQTTIKVLKSEGIYCTRFNETHGSFLLSDSELAEMLALCEEEGYGLVVGIGPRPEYDVKASFYRSEFGLEMGRRLNNNDAIRAGVEEAIRLAELGCRGITLYDIGLMKILDKMRSQGVLPANMMFKTSTHCMAANPLLAKIFHENGANSVTTAHDLGLPVLQEMRRLNPGLVLDVPTDVYKTKGGFIRFYELAEIVQLAAPVMLKMGASAQGHPYDAVKEKVIVDRVMRVGRGLAMLDQHLPEKMTIADGNPHRCIPEIRRRKSPDEVLGTARRTAPFVAA